MSGKSCSVERRLIDAGFVLIKKGASPTRCVPGCRHNVHARPSRAARVSLPVGEGRETAIAGIDTVAIAPSRRRCDVADAAYTDHVEQPRRRYSSVTTGDSIERVQNAITAGLPSAAADVTRG